MVGQGGKKPKLQSLIHDIKVDVESGTAFADALKKRPLFFDDLYCNLVRAGEEAGVLEILLEKIAIYKEKTESLKAKVKKAMIYPAAVLTVAFGVTAVILIFVVPQFESLFSGFGADLPAFTRMVINLSQFFQNWWWAMFGGIIGGVVFTLQTHKRSAEFRRRVDQVALKVPIFGTIASASCGSSPPASIVCRRLTPSSLGFAGSPQRSMSVG